jgi:colicin import membrane protein
VFVTVPVLRCTAEEALHRARDTSKFQPVLHMPRPRIGLASVHRLEAAMDDEKSITEKLTDAISKAAYSVKSVASTLVDKASDAAQHAMEANAEKISRIPPARTDPAQAPAASDAAVVPMPLIPAVPARKKRRTPSKPAAANPKKSKAAKPATKSANKAAKTMPTKKTKKAAKKSSVRASKKAKRKSKKQEF